MTRAELADIVRQHVERCPRCHYLDFTNDNTPPCCREGAALHRAWQCDAGRNNEKDEPDNLGPEVNP
jgi:hypothetical protein